MPHTIKIESITDDDYQRLQSEAAANLDDDGQPQPLSVRNYARLKLGIAPVHPGRPEPKGKPVKQPKGKKRGIKRTKAELRKPD